VVSGPWCAALLAIFSILFFSFSAFGSSTVSFNLVQFPTTPATNRLVIITPIQLTPATNQVATYDRLAYNSGTNGQFTITNLIPGLYQVSIQAPPDTTTFAILAPTNGTVSADTLIVSFPKTVARPQDYSYSASASDARYAIAGGGGLTYYAQFGSGNLTNWSEVDTNVLGTLASATSSLGTAATNHVTGTSNSLYSAIQVAASSAGVVSFNLRTGLVSLTSDDVTGALGLVPVASSITNGLASTGYVAAAIAAIPTNSASAQSASNALTALKLVEPDYVGGTNTFEPVYTKTQGTNIYILSIVTNDIADGLYAWHTQWIDGIWETILYTNAGTDLIRREILDGLDEYYNFTNTAVAGSTNFYFMMSPPQFGNVQGLTNELPESLANARSDPNCGHDAPSARR